MKTLLIGLATAALLSGAAHAQDSTPLRALDLPGEPPGAGAMGPNRGDVVFPDGPINTPLNRRGNYGPYGSVVAPPPRGGAFGLARPWAAPGFYGAGFYGDCP